MREIANLNVLERGLDKARAGCVVAGTLLGLAGLAVLLHSVRGNPVWRSSTDFGLYLKMSSAIRHGTDPYTTLVTTSAGVRLGVPYPPFFAEILIPFAAVGEVFARYLWIGVSLACLLGAIVLLLRGFGRKVPYEYLVLICGAVLPTYAVRNELYHGQVNFALVFLLTVAAWWYVRDRQTHAGIAWGIAAVVKPFLGVVVLYLLWKRAYRAAASAVLTAGALFAASFLVILPRDHDVFANWLSENRYYSRAPYSAQLSNYSLNGFLERAFSVTPFADAWADSNVLLIAGSIALVLSLIAIFVFGIGRSVNTPNNLSPAVTLAELGLVQALALTYGPVTEGAHVFFLIPGFVGVLLLLPSLTRAGARSLAGVLLIAWLALAAFFVSPVLSLSGFKPDLAGSHPHGVMLLVTARVGLLLLAICFTTALALRRLAQPDSERRPVTRSIRQERDAAALADAGSLAL